MINIQNVFFFSSQYLQQFHCLVLIYQQCSYRTPLVKATDRHLLRPLPSPPQTPHPTPLLSIFMVLILLSFSFFYLCHFELRYGNSILLKD